MTNNILTGTAKSLKSFFVKGIIQGISRGLMDRDAYLEMKLDEICASCPLRQDTADDNGTNLDTGTIDNCRREYFSLLLQSYVGRPGDDETKKLFSYFKKCENCVSVKINNSIDMDDSLSRIKN